MTIRPCLSDVMHAPESTGSYAAEVLGFEAWQELSHILSRTQAQVFYKGMDDKPHMAYTVLTRDYATYACAHADLAESLAKWINTEF